MPGVLCGVLVALVGLSVSGFFLVLLCLGALVCSSAGWFWACTWVIWCRFWYVGGLVFWGAFPLFLRFGGWVILRLVLLWAESGCVDWFSWRLPFSVGLV